ncbi:MAG: 3-oxoacyl-ACP reductase FabG [Chelatococcus sp.]|uniref:SDR family NAD(P)-dependent oxidoreductase n=1 Tax=Chelatococcus sp. TaxID=1953771 RepID=UPI0025BE0FF1|nr:3-oxoacyl-ACP reductase FabG [Chelatococcus sp.]MBX3540441.1 3-oxoacyl-ACP reductase FabG [Chelatococcus sp.]
MLPIDLTGQVAFVTASSRGIGRGIALMLADAGASVAVTWAAAREEAEAVSADARSRGADSFAVRCDVTDSASVDEAVSAANARWGKVDILVSNAGVGTAKPMTETTDAEYARVFDLNVRGFVATARAVLPGMKERRAGRVIAISSVTGRSGKAFRSPSPTYAGAKAALIGYTKGLARECAPYGITVNCVCPGWIDWGEKHSGAPAEVRAQALKEIALGRTGTPEDVAGATVFLASGFASYITGATLDVNGGLYMG